MNFEIIFYRKINERCPFEEFYQTCNDKEKLEVAACLSVLRKLGHKAKRPLVGYLEDGIYELRIKVLRKQLRILYFFAEQKIIITHGFVKKTDKVPQSEIEKAKQYRKDFLSRGGFNNG